MTKKEKLILLKSLIELNEEESDRAFLKLEELMLDSYKEGYEKGLFEGNLEKVESKEKQEELFDFIYKKRIIDESPKQRYSKSILIPYFSTTIKTLKEKYGVEDNSYITFYEDKITKYVYLKIDFHRAESKIEFNKRIKDDEFHNLILEIRERHKK